MDKPISLHLCQGQLDSPSSAPEAFLVLQDSKVWVSDCYSCDQYKDQTWTSPEPISNSLLGWSVQASGAFTASWGKSGILNRGKSFEIPLRSLPMFRLG